MKKKWIRDALLFGIQTKTWKIMRLNAVFLFLCLSQAWAISGYSQATKLTLKMSDSKVIEVLDEIEEQSEFFFLFNQKLVDVERKVDVDVEEKSIDFILQNLFAGTDVNHMVIDRQIVLTTFKKDLLPQQQPAVSGKVTDSGGQPLPGVTVVVKSTTRGTVTNADGEYSLSGIPDDATLVFSFVGMLTQEIEVGDQTKIDVRMEVDAIGIEEVVAIGYGVVKKSDLTGSVGTMKAKELAKQPVASVDQALQGRISGVQVTNTSGAPGSNMSIRIRGGNSINAGNEPLYVIDGFIGAGILNTLNPNDIESIEVLKDASSTAIYGSRGSNGVILITTKRGAGTKGSGISFDSYYGIQQPTKKIDVLNGPEFAEYANEFAKYIMDSRFLFLMEQKLPIPTIRIFFLERFPSTTIILACMVILTEITITFH
jgi:TonB-dependent starch-binding outer membrane protein SusC